MKKVLSIFIFSFVCLSGYAQIWTPGGTPMAQFGSGYINLQFNFGAKGNVSVFTKTQVDSIISLLPPSSNYIANQNLSAQSADFWINGTATIGNTINYAQLANNYLYFTNSSGYVANYLATGVALSNNTNTWSIDRTVSPTFTTIFGNTQFSDSLKANRAAGYNGGRSSLGSYDFVYKAKADSTYQTLSNLSTNTSLGTSNVLYSSQNAVKTYVDAQITSHTYTNGYGLNLNSFVFSADSSTLVNKIFFNSVIGTATLARINGYVPTSRTISINGTTHDLTANSTYTVTATATNTLTLGNGLLGGSYNGSTPITASLDTSIAVNKTFFNSVIGIEALSRINAASSIIISSHIAYVDTLGNDATGIIDRPDKPFLTCNAALSALPTNAFAVLDVGVGIFNSPSHSNMRSNMWVKGHGMANTNWVTNTDTTQIITITPPTKMVGGTIFNGTFDPDGYQNVMFSDFGVDVGSVWCTAHNSGNPTDAFIYNDADYTRTHPPLPGFVAYNISALLQNNICAFHAFLVENAYYPYIHNIHTYFGSAGIVLKVTGGIADDLFAFGHYSYGLIIKSNHQIHCDHLLVSNVTIGSINTYDGAGVTVTAQDGQTMSDITLSGLKVYGTTNGLVTYTDQIIDSFNLNNFSFWHIQEDGFQSVINLQNSKISNGIIRDCGADGFDFRNSIASQVSNISVYTSGGNNFVLGSTALSLRVTNLYSQVTTPGTQGIDYVDNGVTISNVFNTGTTLGHGLTDNTIITNSVPQLQLNSLSVGGKNWAITSFTDKKLHFGNITDGTNPAILDTAGNLTILSKFLGNGAIDSLTTSGSSGAASYNTSTHILNIPNYTLAGLGGLSATATTLPSTFVNSSLSSGAGGSFGTLAYSSATLANIVSPGYLPYSNSGNYSNTPLYYDGSNIGYNTTSPVNHSGYSSFTMNGSLGGLIEFQSGGTSFGYVYGGTNSMSIDAVGATIPILFHTNSGQSMKIADGGNVSITGNLSATLPACSGCTNLPVVYDTGTNILKTGTSITGVPSGADGQIVSYYDGGVPLAIGRLSVQNAYTVTAPTTGNTVNLVNNFHNIVAPTGALLALTLSLPSSPADGDMVWIKFTQNITTVTYTNGTVADPITAPTAGGLIVLMYYASQNSWY